MPCPQAHVLHCSHVLCAWRRPGGPFLVDVVVQGRVVHGARPRPATESIDLAVTLAIMDRPKRSRASSAESVRSEEHTSELQSRLHLVCRLLLEKKKKK